MEQVAEHNPIRDWRILFKDVLIKRRASGASVVRYKYRARVNPRARAREREKESK